MLVVTENSFLAELKEENIDIKDINKLAVDSLIKRKMKISSAESCTGGLISKMITEISGASSVFDCGVCSYSNGIKHKILGVDENTLNTLGAVSAETAMQMACGVRKLAESDFGISTTGIAGPTGGTSEKPVGLVYIGYSDSEQTFAVKALFCADRSNNRERVRELSANYALYNVYRMLNI